MPVYDSLQNFLLPLKYSQKGAEPDVEVVLTKRGYLHIMWDWNTLYCEGGRLAKGPEDLFDMLLEDCQSGFELELTKGRRELTPEDSEQARARCFMRCSAILIVLYFRADFKYNISMKRR